MGLRSPAAWVMDPRQEAMGYRIAPGTDGVPGQSTLPPFAEKAAPWSCGSQPGPQLSGHALGCHLCLAMCLPFIRLDSPHYIRETVSNLLGEKLWSLANTNPIKYKVKCLF